MHRIYFTFSAENKGMVGFPVGFPPLYRMFLIRNHLLNKNPVSACRIVYQHMGHRANQPAVLYNGRAAHSLYDAARQGYQLRVRYLEHNAAVDIVMVKM